MDIDISKMFKDKNKELAVGGEVSAARTNESYVKESESGKLTVVIYPNKKLSLRIVGEALISNGVQKHFFLGICYKKGAWEMITVLSTCYELVEEDA